MIELSPRMKDRTGQVFGRLTVVEPIGTHGVKNFVVWRCRCVCGAVVDVRAINLRVGDTKSCGCLNTEKCAERKRTHGMSARGGKPHFRYEAWKAMRQRCSNPNHHKWPDYGARGIAVHPDWDDFPAFLAHVSSLENYGAEGYSLDRIDNDGNYEPGNVRWATVKQQANNRR